VITTVGAGVGVGDGAVVAIDEVEVLANGSVVVRGDDVLFAVVDVGVSEA